MNACMQYGELKERERGKMIVYSVVCRYVEDVRWGVYPLVVGELVEGWLEIEVYRAVRYQFAGGSPIHSPTVTTISTSTSSLAMTKLLSPPPPPPESVPLTSIPLVNCRINHKPRQ